ncbi:MAG TPA: hypothetical protein VGK24_00375 [Candidatus Angelobacter sp.]
MSNFPGSPQTMETGPNVQMWAAILHLRPLHPAWHWKHVDRIGFYEEQ